ncbi:MAG: GNAT family N-acetyltransferase [Desulfobacterales bacterium GWB2_56_26]|nr:MAG: GNAT family N-acetyltransferase [Desulfobacterales bacterium GWB2_56_26]
MLSVDQVVTEYYPALNERKFTGPFVKTLLRRLLHERAFQDFAERYPHLRGIEFVEQVLEYFNFTFVVADRQRENIPTSGRLIIIANHPIGSLDGLALLKLVHEIRSDAKVVANDLLMTIPPLRSHLLPVKNMTGTSKKTDIERILDSLAREEAVIIFPAGEVSRFGFRGIQDGKWQRGFLKIAERSRTPILPVHIDGRCSKLFYLASILAPPLSTVMLVGEMFGQDRKQIRMTIGSLIPHHAYSSVATNRHEKVKLFKKSVYRIGQGKKPLFLTESAIARPERKADLKKEVAAGERLGKTPDGKAMYLFTPADSSPVMREVGRLREQVFRAVGEGTGNRRDLDRFDWYYRHLILWDDEDLEIAGAYRFVDAGQVLAEKGEDGLYSASLFHFDPEKSYFLKNGLELGRSFVQQRYWGKRSLDYLWYGIGAFLAKNTQYRYLFGAVSISSALPPLARELLIYFYKLYFAGNSETVGESCRSRNPFIFTLPLQSLAAEFAGSDCRADFRRLKTLLGNLGVAIPPLYKQYAELCEPGGVVFLDFNVDPSFNNCVDGLVIVDLHKLKEQKRKRYIEETILV